MRKPKTHVDTQAARIASARRHGSESLCRMRVVLAKTFNAVDDEMSRFDASDDIAEQAGCIHRAIQRICNDLLPQLRIDTAADAHAALLLAAVHHDDA